MKIVKQIICIVITVCIAVCCSAPSINKNTTISKFTPPTVPSLLTNPNDINTYLATRYWTNFNFSDTSLIANADITEQAFVDFLQVIYQTDPTITAKAIDTLLTRAITADSLMFGHFTELAERYLYDPNSPYRNEELYIPFLKFIVGCDKVNEVMKMRPRYQLEMALKNRPNTIVTDFIFTLRSGKKNNLHSVKSDYIILFFNNPDCSDCKRVKSLLVQEPIFKDNPRVKIVAIYTDEDLELWHNIEYPIKWVNAHNYEIKKNTIYDLRAIPTLYLLDKNKHVILKDVTIEATAQWLYNNL